MKNIKRCIPESIKVHIKQLFITDKDPKWKQYEANGKQNVFVFLAGFYQNLGDMALTYAQSMFLKQLFPDSSIVLVPSTETYAAVKTIKTFIKPSDIVTIIGGGNMDDMYVSLENARLFVVNSFPNNKIVSFPQTFAFSDTNYGRFRRSISYFHYKRHQDITIFVREEYSLNRIKKYFKSIKIGYCPDIVLSLDRFLAQGERRNVLCCLRNDKEQSLSTEIRNQILAAVKEKYGSAIIQDTVDVSMTECDEDHYIDTLESFWGMLRSCRGVITDRLHCMIFCAITGTPCVVMDNTNHKIKGVYNAWLKNVEFIKYVDSCSPSEVMEEFEDLLKSGIIPNRLDLSKDFQPLREALIHNSSAVVYQKKSSR